MDSGDTTWIAMSNSHAIASNTAWDYAAPPRTTTGGGPRNAAAQSMRGNIFLAPVFAIFLAACNGYSPSTLQSRGMSFPANGCTESTLDQAVKKFGSAVDRLTYDSSWVCVSRTQAKYEQDLAAEEAKLPSKSPLPNLNASTGPVAPVPEPVDEISTHKQQERQAVLAPDEIMIRDKLERPFVASTGRASLGIALAGGGSMAAAFGSGELSGLADRDLVDSASYISSVSGGGYAAYFYYAHKIIPAVRLGETPPTTKHLYDDCVRYPARKGTSNREAPRATPEVLAAITEAGGCDVEELFPRRIDDPKAQASKYQAFVRCQQDVLNPGECSIERTTGDFGVPPMVFLTTLLSMPPSWVSTTIFDWGLVTSPAAESYRNGIGMAYGAMPTNLKPLLRLGESGKRSFWGHGPYLEPRTIRVLCPPESDAYATGCNPGPQYTLPAPLKFEELRKGLLEARANGRPMPFWIINAVATESRSTFGWWQTAGKFSTTSSDIFEMTPVAHGSGRYGYVSAPMSLHGFSVLDSVTAAAAFLDPNQNVEGGRYLRGPIGVLQRVFNLDWGIDISNYNVSDARRTLHTAMPFPMFDSPVSQHVVHRGQSKEDKDRVGSVFIRLIDGGNGENLGLYSLLKRGTRNIVVSDAAFDGNGTFDDICEARRRISFAPDGKPKHLYVPGLLGLDQHCANYEKEKLGYGVHRWAFEFPVLLGCVRKDARSDEASACSNLSDGDSRLFIVKPAVDSEAFRTRQLENFWEKSGQSNSRLTACTLPGGIHDHPEPINCETSVFMLLNWGAGDRKGYCQVFPQHSTVWATANSSHLIYAAYRELARQYTARAGTLIKALSKEDDTAAARTFESIAEEQFRHGLTSTAVPCDPAEWKRSPWAAERTKELGAVDPVL